MSPQMVRMAAQERERGGANADGSTGADCGAYTSCRNGIVGVGFKQKKRNKTRSNKKNARTKRCERLDLTMVSEAGFEPAHPICGH